MKSSGSLIVRILEAISAKFLAAELWHSRRLHKQFNMMILATLVKARKYAINLNLTTKRAFLRALA